MYKRAFVIVLDSYGIGAAADAEAFGDKNTNTLLGIYNKTGLSLPNLASLGLGNIDGVECIPAAKTPAATVARLKEVSLGKDTTVGHWELMGLVSKKPLPTFPEGFPEEIINEFSKRCGRAVLCNRPYSGTDVIRDFGEEHLKTGALIVYTSADSVFQIAANEEMVPIEELYRYSEIAREILVDDFGVGRVIARPFVGRCASDFKRTANRRDFSLKPPKETALDAICGSGLDVIGVGKIKDIFAGQGITEAIPTHGNTEGIEKTKELLKRDFQGLAFINLVDFDMLYGHRQDAEGYARALVEFDEALPEIISGLGDDDALIITADHGCDPTDSSTDHTREDVPMLLFRRGVRGVNLGEVEGLGAVGDAVCYLLGVEFTPDCGDVF